MDEGGDFVVEDAILEEMLLKFEKQSSTNLDDYELA